MRRVVATAAILLTMTACPRAERSTLTSGSPRVLFVGLDGGDWQYLDRLMAEGLMPNLAGLVKEGDRRTILTQHPPLSPLVWTTMMTGVSPLEHRILDFTRYNPVTHTLEPITSDERAVPALWNMATAKGKRVDVFGMWATYPPEPGIILTDREASLRAKGATSSSDAYVRVKIETEHIHDVATRTIAADKPDLAIVYFEGTDAVGHLFAPSGDQVTPRAYFQRVDQMLGDYRRLASEQGSTLVIASDHGFDWDAHHPAESGTNAVTAAKWHREEGILLTWPRGRLHTNVGSVTQIAPMLLELLGLPHDAHEYRRGYHRPAPAAPESGSEEIAKLRALGYISAGDAARGPGDSTRTAGSFNNEGLILREAKRDAEAVTAFEGALHVDPKNAASLWNLSDLLRHLGGHDDNRANALLDAAIDADPHQPRWLLTRGRYALENRDCKRALADFRRAQALMPNESIVYTSIGMAAVCLGDEKTAGDAFHKSLAIEPNQPELERFLHGR
jgi:tetratricopeptide (TPR) repeat protein